MGIYADDWSVAFDYHWGAYELVVAGARETSKAVLRPPLRWAIEQPDERTAR